MRRTRSLSVFGLVFALSLVPNLVLAWGNAGHEIVAYIAADNLTPTAQSQVAKLLGASAATVPRAMASAAVRPDTEFRPRDRSTAPWHFIDICREDQESDIPARCPNNACVTAKIDEYAKRLKDGNYDKWGADGDLAFLIHFVGDVHQPLHDATNADRGGNCLSVNSDSGARELHAAWDTAVVYQLENTLGSGNLESTAKELENKYSGDKNNWIWKPGQTDNIAWESTQVARSDIYEALNIPLEPCLPDDHSCSNAPKGKIDLSSSYMAQASTIAGKQLAKAGYRLASLLNQIWTAQNGN